MRARVCVYIHLLVTCADCAIHAMSNDENPRKRKQLLTVSFNYTYVFRGFADEHPAGDPATRQLRDHDECREREEERLPWRGLDHWILGSCEYP